MIHLLLVEDDAEIREIITGSSDIRNQCHRKVFPRIVTMPS